MKLAMLTSVGLSIVAAAALASQSATAPASETSESRKSCCAKASDGTMKCDKPAAKAGETATDEKPARMRCSLTGEVVDKCCCVAREGKTHCTLADKDVAECCCTPVKDDQSESAKTN